MTSVLLNVYNTVNNLGTPVTYGIVGLMAIVWIWVMFKYLDTSDLND
jgi:hypothetical protein